jgi:hypothetical protein
MNKKLLLIVLILSNCASRDYIDIPVSIFYNLKGVDIEINESFLASKEFSFIKVRLGRSLVSTMTLSKIDDDIYEWVGAEQKQRIYTKHGKIIKTLGLDYDVQIINHSDFSLKDGSNGMHFINFIAPTGMFKQNYEIKALSAKKSAKLLNRFLGDSRKSYGSNEVLEVKILEENFKTGMFWWNKKNLYLLNSSNRVTKSKQYIHPYLNPIELEFYYKY